MAADYFMQRGFRSFAYCGYRGTRYSEDRLAAYSTALLRAGFACAEFTAREPPTNAIFFNEEAKPPKNKLQLRKWIASLPPRTAVFCANDLRAYHVLCAAQEIGRAVPNDLAVLGVDNDELLCSYASVAISSIDPNAFGVGYAAARLMDAALAHPERPKTRPIFKVRPGRLVERTSVRHERGEIHPRREDARGRPLAPRRNALRQGNRRPNRLRLPSALQPHLPRSLRPSPGEATAGAMVRKCRTRARY